MHFYDPQVISGKEKRVDIGAMPIKDESARDGKLLSWVNEDAHLANSWTQSPGTEQIRLYCNGGARGSWRTSMGSAPHAPVRPRARSRWLVPWRT